MSFVGLGYTLAASLAFAGLDLIRKLLAGKILPLPLVFFLTAGTIPFLSGWLVIEGSTTSNLQSYLLPGLSSTAINLLANLLFFYALRVSPFSRTIPYLSLTPVFTATLAVPMLGEWPNAAEQIGIALVVIGAFVLNHGEGGLVTNLLRERGSLVMVFVALLWSVANSFDKLALRHASIAFHSLVVFSGIAIGVLLLLAVTSRLSELRAFRQHWGLIILAMIVVTSGFVFQLNAMAIELVSFVDTFKRCIGSTMALILGYFVFSESVGRSQLAGVALMVIGVILLV